MALDRLIAHYGLWAIGLGAAMEGETVVVLGGITVHAGILPFIPSVLAASAGAFIADQTFFAIGRRFRAAERVRRIHERPAFWRAKAAFERHPTLYVLGFRFLYGLRTISPLVIGTTNLSAVRFMVLNALASLIWAATFITIGFTFGQGIEVLFGKVRALENMLLPAAIVLGLLAGAIHLVLRRRATAQRK